MVFVADVEDQYIGKEPKWNRIGVDGDVVFGDVLTTITV